MNKKLKLLILPFVIILLIAGFYFWNNISNSTQPTPTPLSTGGNTLKRTTLLIDFGNEEKFEKSVSFESGDTALGALEKLVAEEDWKLVSKKYDWGTMIVNICRDKNDCYEGITTDQAWLYFVNGQAGDVAADKFILKEEDKLEWKLTSTNM